MKYLKSVINTVPILSLLFWMVGCQQGIPLNLNDSMASFQQPQNRPQRPSPPQFNFPPAPGSTVPPVPAGAETSCAQYTVPTENIVAACSSEISANADDLAEVAPNCESSFLAITPRVACSILVPQLNNAIGLGGCGIVFTTYRRFLSTPCAAAYDRLLRS